MFHGFLRSLTDLGDSGVTLPLLCLLLIWLWRAESLRAAWLLLRALGVCCVTLLIFKLFFLACGHVIRAGIESPSGHACLTAFCYGALATVIAAQPRPVLRGLAVAGAGGLILLVAVSRVVLGMHTLVEVLVGLGIGLASLALFARPYLRLPRTRLRLRRSGAAMLAVVLLSYGSVMPAERILRSHVPWLQVGVCKAQGL